MVGVPYFTHFLNSGFLSSIIELPQILLDQLHQIFIKSYIKGKPRRTTAPSFGSLLLSTLSLMTSDKSLYRQKVSLPVLSRLRTFLNVSIACQPIGRAQTFSSKSAFAKLQSRP